MPDLRPVAHILGLMLLAFGAIMTIPALLDAGAGRAEAAAFAEAALITSFVGGLIALATRSALEQGLTIRQSFLLTTLTWVVLPAFGALPFMRAEPALSPLDAYFEAVSGVTTTGATILADLDRLSDGLKLWRSLLQWLGGLGIVIVALVFLPVMRVGGMQHFRAEGFDTMGKVLPRAADISFMLLQIYAALSVLCALCYLLAGMNPFEAINHAMTTIATGGFSTRDESLGAFPSATHYVSALFMWLAGLPFIRYIQLIGGDIRPLWRDVQVRAYFRWTLYAVGLILLFQLAQGMRLGEEQVRSTLVNTVSLFSGTGFAVGDVASWGDFPLLILLVVGFIGACTASTGCALKIFRFLVLFEAIKTELWRLIYPSRMTPIEIDGRRVEEEVIVSVVVMFTAFVLGFGILMIALSLAGLEMRTAITAAWTALCNVGPAFGADVGPTGALDGFPPTAKALMIVGMILGRLELVAVLVLFLPRFWRP